jgi:hypothetical protein
LDRIIADLFLYHSRHDWKRIACHTVGFPTSIHLPCYLGYSGKSSLMGGHAKDHLLDHSLRVQEHESEKRFGGLLPTWLKSYRLPVMGPRIADQVAK